MLIRPATVTDAQALGELHVRVWNETYRGIMPDTLLDRLDAEKSAQTWREQMPALREKRQTLVVAEAGGALVGFAGCGPRRKEKLASDGEIYMINIASTAKRRHTGTRLMLAMAGALTADGFEDVGLWVLEKNLPARAFYERLGGTPGLVSEEDHDGVTLTDVAILWPRVELLTERTNFVLAT
ncbi:MAG: N-acetyltransferase family protein [Micropepsaceae bacterium]